MTIFNFWFVFGVLSSVVGYTDCCSSKRILITRTISTPPSSSSSSSSSSIYQCTPEYDLNYCLNGGRCFNYTVASFTIPFCECTEGYLGERCEQKYLNVSYGSFMSRTFRIHKASICTGALIALFISICVGYAVCYYRLTTIPYNTPPR